MKFIFGKNKSKDNFYVKVLRWAKEKGAEGFSLSEMDQDLSLTKKQSNLIDYTANTDQSVFINPESGSSKFKLSFGGYFKLLEYDELQEARTSATQARLYAIFAILVASIHSFIEVYYR